MSSSTMFKPATRKKLKLRMALCSPAGYGKSMTALRFAYPLAPNRRVAAIDTEHGALSKYKGLTVDGTPWEFDVCELQHFAPTTYTAAIRDAAAAGYEVLIIDSLSHAWSGVGGALEQVDRKAGNGGNSFTAWKDVTPQHNELVEAILAFPGHVIATMRTKTEYALEEEVNRSGKKVIVPKRVGMKPVQREGMDYEFDIVADLDETHTLIVGKTRCPAIDGQRVVKPGPEFMRPVIAWLGEGEAEWQPSFVMPLQPLGGSGSGGSGSGSGNGNVNQKPTETAANGGTAELCSDIQRQTILDVCQVLGIQGDAYQKILERRGVTNVRALTRQQADEIIQRLRQLSDQRKAEAEKALTEQGKAERAAEKAKVEATAEQRRSENPDAGGTISEQLKQVIATACRHLGIDGADLKAIVNKRDCHGPDGKPAGRKCQTLDDLSYSQANEINNRLDAKLKEKFPDGSPF